MDKIEYEILLRRIQRLEAEQRRRRSSDGRADDSFSKAARRVGWGDVARYYEDSPEGQMEREHVERLMKYIKDGGDLGG